MFTGVLFAVMSIQVLTTGVLAELLSRTFFESAGHGVHSVLSEDSGMDSDWFHNVETDSAIDPGDSGLAAASEPAKPSA